MLFTEEHLNAVVAGDKTQTRRQWDTPQVKEGNSYRATNDLFTPRDEAPAYIVVIDVWEERLGDITATDASAEGGYTVEEFREEWREINGNWDPDEHVWAVEFEGYRTDPRQ